MTSYLRKSIAMGVYAYNNQNQNFGYFASDWPATNTPYVRFWIDWTQLAPHDWNQPATDTTPLPQGGTVQQYVQAIDAQIRYAKSNGLKVVLTFYQYPLWTNGQSSSTPYCYYYPPLDLSTSGPWAVYLWWCLSRWSALNPDNGGAYADFFEICNEPNMAPVPGGGAPSASIAGQMMMVAQYIQRQNGITTPILAGPAILDVVGTHTSYIDSRTYAANLLAYLSSNGFAADSLFAWSHHNYLDIKNGDTTVAQDIRNTLAWYGWTGWPYEDPSNPYILQTEGGAYFDALTLGLQQETQIHTGYTNCHNDTTGAGLAMFTTYLDVTDPNPSADTGLRAASSGYPTRLAYGQWANEPQP